MNDVLYLDTARLGQVSQGAERALTDALKVNKALGGSMYFMDFLLGGHNQLPNKENYDGLTCWKGFESLANDFQDLVFGSQTGKACFASRSTVLMKLASQMLFRRCRNVLVSDLNWPAYGQILANAIHNDGCRITKAPIRHAVFNDGWSANDLAAHLLDVYLQNRCDGIFLPAVCNYGVRLPVQKLISEIRKISPPRFVVIDAAQAINHVDLSWAKDVVDITIGGTHKWLKAYEPMAVGLFSKTCSASFIENLITRELEMNQFLDPLLNLSWRPQSPCGETVNLCPLFAAAGALGDATKPSRSHDYSTFLESFDETGWQPHEIHRSLQSNILLATNNDFSNSKLGSLTRFMGRLGVAVSDYGNGLCRFSVPGRFSESDLETLRFALRS